MKNSFIPTLLLLVSISCLVACSSSNSTQNKDNIINKDISKTEAKALIQNNSDLIIVDVRTPGEIANGKIKGALEIDYKANDFEEKIKMLDKNQKYLIYCASGGRSGRTLKKMASLGFKESYNLLGGYSDWKE